MIMSLESVVDKLRIWWIQATTTMEKLLMHLHWMLPLITSYPPRSMELSTAVKYFEWQHMLGAIKQPGICHVCGQHEFEIHSPGHTQLFGGEISESLQSQTTQKQSCSPSSNSNSSRNNSSNNKPQISCSCMLRLLQLQLQLQLPSQTPSQIQIQSRRQRRGKCAFCGSGAAFRVFGILRKSFRNICAPTMANIFGFETI